VSPPLPKAWSLGMTASRGVGSCCRSFHSPNNQLVLNRSAHHSGEVSLAGRCDLAPLGRDDVHWNPPGLQWLQLGKH
jgi:hypothetical protein